MVLEITQPKTKHALYAKSQGTLQNVAMKKIGDNPVTSHIVFQEHIKLQHNNPNTS